jgi:hypothetical protein
MWAAHVVHHQSEDYNLGVALRQSALQPFFSTVFYWPLAVLGFPPSVFALSVSLNTLYQFWIHTQMIGSIGPLEKILMTPSHHRVHHGRNPIYIDRNHAATFIIWDQLFGTFQAETEEVAYGVTTPLASWNPVWANLAYWRELWDTARHTRRFADRIRIFVKPPGWFPAELGGFRHPPDLGPNPIKFDRACPRPLGAYVVLQFVQLFAIGEVMFLLFADLSGAERAIGVGSVCWGLMNAGALLDRKGWASTSELVRLLSLLFLGLTLIPGLSTTTEMWVLGAVVASNMAFALAAGVRPTLGRGHQRHP